MQHTIDYYNQHLKTFIDGTYTRSVVRRGLQVDRSTCPYNEEMLKDRKARRSEELLF